MPTSMKIEGSDAILLKLQTQQRIAKEYNGQVSVVYEAPYAVFVHENLQAYHPHGQAKFLEQPARAMRRQLAEFIMARVKEGYPLPKALYQAAELLKAASQKLVPVDTGFLRESATIETTFQGFSVTKTSARTKWQPKKMKSKK